MDRILDLTKRKMTVRSSDRITEIKKRKCRKWSYWVCEKVLWGPQRLQILTSQLLLKLFRFCFWFWVSFHFLSFSLSHTHTRTHTLTHKHKSHSSPQKKSKRLKRFGKVDDFLLTKENSTSSHWLLTDLNNWRNPFFIFEVGTSFCNVFESSWSDSCVLHSRLRRPIKIKESIQKTCL